MRTVAVPKEMGERGKGDDELQKLIDKNQEIFQNTLGKYKFKQIDLELKEDFKPIFLKPRKVPFALKEKIEKELNLLEQGVISKVSNNECGTPLVPVLKPDGSVRLCGERPDGLSRLPLKVTEEEISSEFDYVNFVEDKIPLNWSKIKQETRKDSELFVIYKYIQYGWPKNVNTKFKPFSVRKSELSIEGGVIMWGYRAVIPKKFRTFLLKELHYTHLGMSKMKTLARNYFWWPGLDVDIEKLVKGCDPCMSVRAEPEKAELILWENASRHRKTGKRM
ncbi:Integrase zinc binding domain [Popillia japonica]|uniref:RNA-directed DNA polymerase n=1 Tax=Popillia japonica TaxID=7064 RepID=A0AAW1LBS2_POPJA